MRHQYALVKQKINKQESSIRGSDEEFDWMEGVSHWPNFLRYKEVFGDVPLVLTDNDGDGGCEGDAHEMGIAHFGQLGHVTEGDFVGGIDGVENGVMDLEFDYDGEEGEDNYTGGNKSDAGARLVCEAIEPISSDSRKKRKVLLKGVEKKAFDFFSNQLVQLEEMEARFEQRELERNQERLRREQLQVEMDKDRERKWEEMEKEQELREKNTEKFRRQWIQEWEAMERAKEEEEAKN